MRLIIAGGRKFNGRTFMTTELNKLMVQEQPESLTIICGDAKGADLLGASIAKNSNVPVEHYPADWNDMREPCVVKRNAYGTYNALAGMKRNKIMGDTTTHLIAFWDGKSTGTKDMIDYMASLNKNITIIKY